MVKRVARGVEAALFVSTWVFPIAGFPLVACGWWLVSDGSWATVALVMGVPLVFGYVVPGIGVNVMKRWRFTSGWRIGGYYAHHGFVYSSKMAFVLLLAVRDPRGLGGWGALAAVLVSAAATALGGWWHDLHAVRAGKIELLVRDGRSAESLVHAYAPATFLLLGAAYAGACVAAFPVLARDPAAIGWVFPAALAALLATGALAFLALDPGALRTRPSTTIQEDLT